MNKWWLDSLTVRGGLLAALPTLKMLFALFGLEIQDGEMQAIVDGLAGLAGLAGTAIILIGRWRAGGLRWKK